MKKLLSWLLTLSMLLSMSVTVSAEDTTEWAPTATSYTADFTNADELSKWKQVLATSTSETVSNGVVNWGGSGTAYLLPVASMENFVFDAEFTHTGGDGFFAVIFGQDSEGTNIANKRMRFRSVNGRPLLEYSDMTVKNSEPSEPNGYQWNVNTVKLKEEHYSSDYNLTSKFKVIIYNKELSAWVNDQLVYSYKLDNTYTGGYIGLHTNYYRGTLRSLSVREATSGDLVFAESFDMADSDTSDTTVGNLTIGSGSYKMTIAGNSVGNGNAWWTKPGGNTMYIDKNKNIAGDHAYTAGFTFSSSDNNGTTRYIAPVFGIKDTESKALNSYYVVYIKWNGEIDIDKVTYDEANSKYVSSWSTTEGNYMKVSAADTRAKFPDKLGTHTTSNDVLKPDVMWEYKHVLHDGTLDVYLDDVLMLSVTSADFENLEGYTGLYGNGMASKIYYLGARAVDSNIDLNRPNQVKIRVADVNGLTEDVGDKIVRFYTTETTDDVTTETLYGTAYADKNGLFDLALGHNQKYAAKLYDSATATEPASTTNVTYKAGQQFVIDFPTDANFSTLADVEFADNAAADVSANANPIVLVADAKTEAVEAFGGKEALVLDGIGDAAQFTNKEAFSLKDAQKLTVEAVFMPEERDGIKTMAVVGGAPLYGAGKQGGFGLYVDQDSNGNDIIAFRIYTSSKNEVTAPCEMNKAYYAAGIYDGENMKLYVNGELVATKAVTGDIYSISTVTPAIGAEWYYLNDQRKHFFKGAIADAEITNGVKDEAAITSKLEEYIGTDGYALEGEEFIDDITAKVSFSNEEPNKGDVVTAAVTVRNAGSEAKTVSVKMVPGYFAALTSGTDAKELTVEADSTAVAEFTYKLLEGGREPFKAYVSESGEQVAYAEKSLSVIGAGYYKGDIHNHSTRSDGVNTFEENLVEGFGTKNLSYSYSTEHNQYNYYHVNKANTASSAYNPKQFIAMPGSEFTTKFGHANAYALDNDVSTPDLSKVNSPFWNEDTNAALEAVSKDGEVSAEGWQSVIDAIEKDYGGVMYLNHTADPTYFIKDELIAQLSGFTGYEVWNGAASAFAEMTLSQRDTWDKINSVGWGHVAGQASTDAHGSVAFGTIQKISYMSEISKDEINRSMEDGNAIGTNGPEIRFNINGVAMNDTAIVTGSQANFNIDVYDPMGDILEVKLIKNKVSGSFTTDNREEVELYKKADGADAISAWKYSEARDVAAGEFYRVEVTTAENPYGSITGKGLAMTDEGAGMGWAFTNNIWISNEGTSNSTNISSVSYDGDNIVVAELPTGIKYLKGSGNMVLTKLDVVADGTAEKTVENDLVTITVTANDGSVNKTELYLVGDMTVVEAETTLSSPEAYAGESSAEAYIVVDDEAGVLNSSGAKVIMAVYKGNTLLGTGIANVDNVVKEQSVLVEYATQSDLTNVTAKAMLWRDLTDMTPLCDSINVELSIEN